MSNRVNVLVYRSSASDSALRFQSILDGLSSLIDSSKHALQTLTAADLPHSPWPPTASLVIFVGCDSPSIDPSTQQRLRSYVQAGGALLAFGAAVPPVAAALFATAGSSEAVEESAPLATVLPLQPPAAPFAAVDCAVARPLPAADGLQALAAFADGRLAAVCGPFGDGAVALSAVRVELPPEAADFDESATELAALRAGDASRRALLRALLAGCRLHCVTEPPPTPGAAFVLCSLQQQETLLEALKGLMGADGVVRSGSHGLQLLHSLADVPRAQTGLVPLVLSEQFPTHVTAFRLSQFERTLRTRALGRTLVYGEVLESTQTLLDDNYGFLVALPAEINLVVCANRQVGGRGRRQNVWVSPAGCLMFSFHVRVPFAEILTPIQYVAALALVEAVRSTPGYETIDLRLKWPNDIYCGQRSVKMGGVLVTSSYCGSRIDAIVGCGFNVSNALPTICLDELIRQHNETHGTALALLSKEEVLAGTLNKFEELFEWLRRGQFERFKALYYRRWLHSGAQVTLADWNNRTAVISGLDIQWYLEATDPLTGDRFQLEPNGNSYDMLQQLIARKS